MVALLTRFRVLDAATRSEPRGRVRDGSRAPSGQPRGPDRASWKPADGRVRACYEPVDGLAGPAHGEPPRRAAPGVPRAQRQPPRHRVDARTGEPADGTRGVRR